MVCPQCQQVVVDHLRFCTNCGQAITQGERVQVSPTAHTELVSAPGQAPNPTAHDPLIGRVLEAKYQLIACLGAGGMGAVYRARRAHIGDEVAVKILHPQYLTAKGALERFRREARAAALLHHPNVVAIYDYGEAPGEDVPAFIVMELVAGRSLRQLLQAERMFQLPRAVSLMREICAGVGAAHRHQVVHRDLKPDNIIVLPPDPETGHEVAKVVDFGLAKLRDLAADHTLTQTGAVMGTPYYMSPEQCRGDKIDARADVYSLGALLYEVLAGAPPFLAPTPTGVVAKHLTEAPPPLPEQLGLPPLVEAVIMRALAKDPEARPTDATTLARELQAAMVRPAAPPLVPTLITSEPPLQPAPPTPTQVSAQATAGAAPSTLPSAPRIPADTRPASSHLGLIVGLVVTVMIILSGLGVGAWLLLNSRHQPEAPLHQASAEENQPPSSHPAPSPAPVDKVDGRKGGISPPEVAGSEAPRKPDQEDHSATLPVSSAMERAENKLVRGEVLNENDLLSLSRSDLRLLRNVAYARHGRTFETPELRRYFESRPWYQPRLDYSDKALTSADRANLNLIQAAEKGTESLTGTRAEASSTLTPASRYAANNTLDGRLDTAWAEGVPGPGIGEWIRFTFSPRLVQSVEVYPGYGKSEETFYNNNRLKRVTLVFSDGTAVSAPFADEMRRQRIHLNPPVRTSSLKLIIEEVYRGTRYDDTTISEISWQ